MDEQSRILALAILGLTLSTSEALSATATYCERSPGGHADHNKCVKVTDDEAVPVDIYGRRKEIKGKARINDDTFCDQSNGGHIDRNSCFHVRDGELYPVDIYGRQRSIDGVRVDDRYKKIN